MNREHYHPDIQTFSSQHIECGLATFRSMSEVVSAVFPGRKNLHSLEIAAGDGRFALHLTPYLQSLGVGTFTVTDLDMNLMSPSTKNQLTRAGVEYKRLDTQYPSPRVSIQSPDIIFLNAPYIRLSDFFPKTCSFITAHINSPGLVFIHLNEVDVGAVNIQKRTHMFETIEGLPEETIRAFMRVPRDYPESEYATSDFLDIIVYP